MIRPGETLNVKEVFATIQGEGPFAGQPSVFVRLADCNLKCWFCDTDFRSGEEMKTAVLCNLVEERACRVSHAPWRHPLVVLTGGEPMLQNILLFVNTMLGAGWRVQIETAGTVWTELPENEGLSVVVSPKTPKVHERVARVASAYKYLIRAGDPFDKADGLPISQTQDKEKEGGGQPLDAAPKKMARPCSLYRTPVFLQPVEESDAAATKANIDEAVRRCLRYGWQLSLQQHKILGLQ